MKSVSVEFLSQKGMFIIGFRDPAQSFRKNILFFLYSTITFPQTKLIPIMSYSLPSLTSKVEGELFLGPTISV